MSAFQVRCPTCQTLLRPTAALTPGCTIRCPSCQTAFKVSVPRPAPPAHVQPPPRKLRPSVVPEKARRARQDDDEPPPSNHARAWIIAVVAVLVLMGIGFVVARNVLDKPDEQQVVQDRPPVTPQPPFQPGSGQPTP